MYMSRLSKEEKNEDTFDFSHDFLCKVPLLVIDSINITRMMEKTDNFTNTYIDGLYNTLKDRYHNLKPTIVTSRWPLTSKIGASIQNVYGQEIYELINDNNKKLCVFRDNSKHITKKKIIDNYME